MSRIDEWNQRHQAGAEAPRPPATIVVEAAARMRAGRALDLASGSGRNALHLAERGWKVVAVDAAIEAIRKLQRLGPPAPAVLIADLERDSLPFADLSFDLVTNVFFLHRPLFDEIRRVLKTGGLFAAQIHIRGINPAFCVAPGEVHTRFGDWEILEYREGDTAEMIARKRSVSSRP